MKTQRRDGMLGFHQEMECWASIFISTLGTTRMAQVLALHAG